MRGAAIDVYFAVFQRDLSRAMLRLAIVLLLAAPNATMADIVQMTDIKLNLQSRTCPADLNDVRDFTDKEKCGPNYFDERPCLVKLGETNNILKDYNTWMSQCRLKEFGSRERPPGHYNEVYVVEKEFVVQEDYRRPYGNSGGVKYLDVSGTIFVMVCPADTARVEEITSPSYCAGVQNASEKTKCLRETKGLLNTIREYNKFMSLDCGGTSKDGMRQLLPWGGGQEPAGSTTSTMRESESQRERERREQSDDQFNREIDQNFISQQRENVRLRKSREEAEAAEMARLIDMITQGLAAGRGSGGSGGATLNASGCAQIAAHIRSIQQALGTGDGSAASRQQAQNALNQNIAIYNSRCG